MRRPAAEYLSRMWTLRSTPNRTSRSRGDRGDCPRKGIGQRLGERRRFDRKNGREARSLGRDGIDLVAEDEPGHAAAGRLGDCTGERETRKARGAERVSIMFGND